MNILVACEESQRVCAAFREKGHTAFSCDLVDCSGGHPEWHVKGDVLPLLDGDCHFTTMDGEAHHITGRWDMILAFPPCTHLKKTTFSGVAYFARDENGKILSWNDPRTAIQRSKTYPGVAKAMAEQWGQRP